MAFRANDLKAICGAEILINRYLREKGEEPFSGEIRDLPEKIADNEDEISRIKNTEPYTYKAILDDAESIEKTSGTVGQDRVLAE